MSDKEELVSQLKDLADEVNQCKARVAQKIAKKLKAFIDKLNKTRGDIREVAQIFTQFSFELKGYSFLKFPDMDKMNRLCSSLDQMTPAELKSSLTLRVLMKQFESYIQFIDQSVDDLLDEYESIANYLKSNNIEIQHADDELLSSVQKVIGSQNFNCWRIINKQTEKAYEAYLAEHQGSPVRYLWHGSPQGNWLSIIANGLKLKQVVNGEAYGKGIYFTDIFYGGKQYSSVGIGARVIYCGLFAVVMDKENSMADSRKGIFVAKKPEQITIYALIQLL